MIFFEAQQHQRVHSIADGFNLWGRLRDLAWINYATAPTAEELERSKLGLEHVSEFRIVQGYRKEVTDEHW